VRTADYCSRVNASVRVGARLTLARDELQSPTTRASLPQCGRTRGKREYINRRRLAWNVGVGRSYLARGRATVATSTFWEKLVGALYSESDEVEPGFDSRPACSRPPVAAL
jgi:hypothetical protein